MHFHDALHLLRMVLLTLALAPFVFYLLSIWSAIIFFAQRDRGQEQPFTPAVSILKPCRGLDREAYANFASFCRQDYPEFEILFAVGDPKDPAVAVIEQVIRDFPEVPIRLLRSVPAVGPNGKVNKLIRLAAEARHDLLVINDSDVRVTPDYLRKVAAPFRDPRVGAATAMYRAETHGSLGAELEAVGITSEFQAGVLLARQMEGVKFALGATMACTRKALEAIGGFEALVSYHSDDYELGSRIASQGYEVELLRDPVTLVHGPQTIREAAGRHLRAALSTRHARPGGHFGLLLTFGLPWSLMALAAAPSHWIAACYPAAYVVLRSLTAWTVGVWGLGDRFLRNHMWLVPLRDAMGFATWVASFFCNQIEWRGTEFRIVDGKLVPRNLPATPHEAETEPLAPAD